MSQQKKIKPLDELLSNAVGRQDLDFDFDKWQKQHPNEIRQFQAKTSHSPARSHHTWRIIVKSKIAKRLTAAAAIIIATIIGINQFDRNHSIAFAQIMEQVEKAKTITWKTTFYEQFNSKDEKRQWIKATTRHCAYKSPGLYRDVTLDENMQITHLHITDTVNMKELSLVPTKKTATLSERAVAFHSPQGPFSKHIRQIQKNSLEWVGKKKTASGQVNIFRNAFRDEANNKDWSYDYWIDEKTKQLVAVQVPGSDIYDPEKDPARDNPPEKEYSWATIACHIKHDIDFNSELDDSLFSLEPPEDYTLKIVCRAQVTEKEMIEYFGILADFNDKTFPDQLSPVAITSDRINKAFEKPPQERTEAEQKFLDTRNHYMMAGLNLMPIGHFRDDHTVKNSFRYLGKGVKLGDKDRIVCWYRLKGSSTYHVLYGDLSVNDVAPQDLPLSTEPPANIKD